MFNNEFKMDFTIRQNGVNLIKGKDTSINKAMEQIDYLMKKKIGRKGMLAIYLIAVQSLFVNMTVYIGA